MDECEEFFLLRRISLRRRIQGYRERKLAEFHLLFLLSNMKKAVISSELL